MRTFHATDLPSKTMLCFIVLLIVFTLQSTGCSKKAVEAEPMTAMQAPESAMAAVPTPLGQENAAIPEFNTEEYDLIRENTFKDTVQNPLSTFSIDVDTASYSNIRRYINMNRTPPKDAVRIEENHSLGDTSQSYRFAAAVAGFGMLLRESKFKGGLTYDDVLALAKGARGRDETGDRGEFIRMVQTCKLLAE